MTEPLLWEKIQEFELDDPQDSFTFSDRLARDNQWTHRQTFEVMEEYKRFMYLICIGSQPLSPPSHVDECWHLHLLYTRSYWIDFCKHTINRDIHHAPTKGGDSERDKHLQLYTYTLELYTSEFKASPPEWIWPTPNQLFATTKISNNNNYTFDRLRTFKKWITK